MSARDVLRVTLTVITDRVSPHPDFSDWHRTLIDLSVDVGTRARMCVVRSWKARSFKRNSTVTHQRCWETRPAPVPPPPTYWFTSQGVNGGLRRRASMCTGQHLSWSVSLPSLFCGAHRYERSAGHHNALLLPCSWISGFMNNSVVTTNYPLHDL